jgi:hypothetical protein
MPMTMTAPTTAELILKIGTALLITFAVTLVLVHAEIYFSHSLSAMTEVL